MDPSFVELVRRIVAEQGLDLEDLVLTPAGSRRVLKVAVDGDAGVGIDEITAITRALAPVLDADPAAVKALGQAPYTLEVTTRGVAAPLTEPRHWRRNLDRLVKVDPVEGAAVSGRITEVGETGVTLDVRGRARTIAYADISRAVVQVELNRKER